jgi:hypothetical protein
VVWDGVYGVWCRGESWGMCMMVDNTCGLLYLTLGYCCIDAIFCLLLEPRILGEWLSSRIGSGMGPGLTSWSTRSSVPTSSSSSAV